MPTQTIPRLGGMVTEPSLRGVGDCVLAENVTYFRGGYPQRRRGTGAVYTLGGGGGGPIMGLGRYRSRTGADYRVIASYDGTYGLQITVTSGAQQVGNGTFALPAAGLSVPPYIYAWPVSMTPFGDSLYVTGEATGKFIRCRFQRHAVTVAEAALFDRTINSYSPADDPGPWLSRLYSARCAEAFRSRFFIAGLAEAPDTVFWSNIGDALGWSAQNYLRIREGGKITALAVVANDYLLVFKETMIFAVRGGFTTAGDTSVELVEPRVGAYSQRGLTKVPGAGVYCMSAQGIAEVRPDGVARILSDDIRNWLRGQVDQTDGADFTGLLPNPESLRSCPMAYSATRRELYVGLSTASAPIDNSAHQYPGAPNMLLVGYLGDERPKWSLYHNSLGAQSGTYDVFSATALLAGTDADGRDEVLYGTTSGRVMCMNRGSLDTVATSSSTFNTVAIPSKMVPKLFANEPVVTPRGTIPPAQRVGVQSIEVEWRDEDMTAPAVRVVYNYGTADGSSDGSTKTIGLSGRGALASFGTSGLVCPATLKTAGIARQAASIIGVATTDVWHAEIQAAATIRSVKVVTEPLIDGI